MSDIQALRSYLVGLGFSVNNVEFSKFSNALRDASKLVENSTGKIAGDLLKWQGAIVGMFATVTGAIVASIDKVAMADQEYRLFGERMFMDTKHARALKTALDALGEPLEAIAFDPELHRRFMQLQLDQKKLAGGLGSDFESTMVQIRDIRFEFTRLKVELQYLAMGVVKNIFEQMGFGSGNVLNRLRQLNEYIITNIPRWSKQFATYIVPILKDAWMIFKDLLQIARDFATLFDNIVGLLSGDESLQGTANFEKFAGAVSKVVHWLALVEHYLLKVFGLLSGAVAGGSAGSVIGGLIGFATGGPAGALAGAAAGGTIGTGIGAVGGGIFDLWRGTRQQDGANTGQETAFKGGSGIAEQARQLAQSVSSQIGVPANIIFSQWAHETGNFTNRGATQLNNLAGIRKPGSTEYRNFNSLQDFSNYYSGLISRRYKGALGAKDVDSFASALKRGGYFEDSLSNYEHGMKSKLGSYSGGSRTTITVGDIHIMQPNATPTEIKNSVIAAVNQARDKQIQRNLTELTPVYS